MKQIECLTAQEDINKRCDLFLTENTEEVSRSYLQKLFKDGCITKDGQTIKPNYRIKKAGEVFRLELPDAKEPDICAENIPLDIIYEDSDVIIVNKPKEMVVHPAPGNYEHTLVNALMYHYRDSLSGINGVKRPGIVHRIDKNTTGSLIVCKNDAAHAALADQLKDHSIRRKYRAIVHGYFKEDHFTLENEIGRDEKDRKKMSVHAKNGRRAVTDVEVLEKLNGFSYIECTLHTGRTHQIRVQLSAIGHPVLGDDIYGPKKCPVSNLSGQTLHAYLIGFHHPKTGEYMEFTAPLPEYFEKLLIKLQ